MKIEDATLCVNCDEVYDSNGLVKDCPVCASSNHHLICRWLDIRPSESKLKEKGGMENGTYPIDSGVGYSRGDSLAHQHVFADGPKD